MFQKRQSLCFNLEEDSEEWLMVFACRCFFMLEFKSDSIELLDWTMLYLLYIHHVELLSHF
jgi:hypothetical protein